MDLNITMIDQHRFGRLGGLLPQDHRSLSAWLDKLQKSSKQKKLPLLPVMQEFKELIDEDPIVRKQLNMMIAQVPWRFINIHSKSVQNVYLTSVEQMLELINFVLDTAPEYNSTDLVGCPINAILDWCMATPAGNAAFCNYKITAMFKKILTCWGDFLSSPASRYVIATRFESKHEKGVIKKGWMCKKARKNLHMKDYEHDPDAKYWGYTSWNDFFTRNITPTARPIDEPDNDSVIVSACDSTVYAIRHDLQKQAKFWIKEQPYSLQDMLNNDPVADSFVGGDIYQAFLCALDYHRWHSPVSGVIAKTEIIDGTYYAEAQSVLFDDAGPDKSQAYITQLATRAIVYIEADNPDIGLMCALFVGMAEISSCKFEPNIVTGARVEKGDKLGYFQFGGSTHCLIFRPDVINTFTVKEKDQLPMGKIIAVSNTSQCK